MERTVDAYHREMLKAPADYGIGLVHQGAARFWRFDRLLVQPVVNDQMGDLNLLIFFDVRSRSARAWDRQLDGKTLTFRLVDRHVRDTLTESSWDLRRGKAFAGKLKGQQLAPLPATMSLSDVWPRFHPATTHWIP